MKVFVQTQYAAGAPYKPASVLDRRAVSMTPDVAGADVEASHQPLIESGFDPYAAHNDDYIVFNEDGSYTLGFYVGDESVVDVFTSYVADRNQVKNLYFVIAELITCENDAHPCDTKPEPWFTKGNFWDKFDPDDWVGR